jgi:hypothetical protein
MIINLDHRMKINSVNYLLVFKVSLGKVLNGLLSNNLEWKNFMTII